MNIDPDQDDTISIPVINRNTEVICNVASRKEVRNIGLSHGQVDLWIPGKSKNHLIVQVKTSTHGKRVSTAGGLISCSKDDVNQIIGKHLSDLARKTAVSKGMVEAGVKIDESELKFAGRFIQSFRQPNPANGLWQNGSRLIYFLPKRIDLDEILENPDKEQGTDFLEVSIDELLALKKGQVLYKTRFEHDAYKQIFGGLSQRMQEL